MANKWTRRFVVLLLFLAISNLPVVKDVYGLLFDEDHYRYSNANGTYTGQDIKSRRYNLSPTVPKQFLAEYPGITDTLVYRLFWKNPLAFWRWYEYVSGDPRYNLPYKSWKEIEKKRLETKIKTRYQEF